MQEVHSRTGDIVASLRRIAAASPDPYFDQLKAAIGEILRLKRKAEGQEILLREVERLQSDNARLRGLCGLSPKQPVPDLLG